MEQYNFVSRPKPSNSRREEGSNSQMQNSYGSKPNKDVSNRRKCPECDGKIGKESSKSKSRVWKKVMWFTRRSKGPKNDICQCHLTDESFSSSMEERHSNSWSFTRSASKKFRFSSRKRQCKSESTKKPFRVQGSQGKKCLSNESPRLSMCAGSLSSSGANSPTATGSFCDFGASCHSGGTGTRRHKNAFVLSEIAKELNPPVKYDDMPLIDTHSSVKKLCKSSSSVSCILHPQKNLMSLNVRRSKSFPGSQSCVSPSKRRLISTTHKTLASFSPPLKQRCYGLRRTATFSGELNAEFPKISMKKSKSINNAELMEFGKSTSLGEIRDQSGSVVGIVHFYKSSKNLISRRPSSFNQEVKKDGVFVEDKTGCKTVNQANLNIISKEGSEISFNECSTTVEPKRGTSLLPYCSTVKEAGGRDSNKTDVADHTIFDNESDNLHVLNNGEVLHVTKEDGCKIVTSENHNSLFSDVNVPNVPRSGNSVQEIKTVNKSSHISTTGCVLNRSQKIFKVSDDEKIHKPGLMRQERSLGSLLSKDETPNSSSHQAVSAVELPKDCISNTRWPIPEFEPLTKPHCQLLTEHEQSSENVELSRHPPQGHITENGYDYCNGDQMLTEPTFTLGSLEQTCEDITESHHASDIEIRNLSHHFFDNVPDECDGSHLTRRQKSPKPCQNSEILEKLTFKIDAEMQSNDSKQCAIEFTEKVPNLCSKDVNGTAVKKTSLFDKTENGFCGKSNANPDGYRLWEGDISIGDVLFPEIANDSSRSKEKCQSNESGFHFDSLDVIATSSQSDLEHCNHAKLNHSCPNIMPEDDVKLDVLDHKCNIGSVTAPFASQEKSPIHSSVITNSKNLINSPTLSTESANSLYEECSRYKANIPGFKNCENLRIVDKPTTSGLEVRECPRTSDYVSIFDDKTFSPSQSDVPIHTWKTSESDVRGDEIGHPVPGETFKMRTELMLSWFEEFNDEQRNIILKKILNRCELPQMHLLSVAMENNLHKTCPPNCQDMLVWLPYTVTLKILSYLDPVSLCRCNQVNRAWNELTDNPMLWQRLTRNPDYQLSEASSRRQYQKFTQANGEIHWKKVFAERFLLQRNWLDGTYKLRTFQGHNQGIACVQFDDTRIVSGSSDKTIKLWDISNMPSELMLTLEGHSGTVRCLDLYGNRLVSGSTDRTIKVWDLSVASYWAGASCKVTMVGHLHTVRCLQADEKKLVSGSYDKTVKVWDLKTGECHLTLRGHTAAVLCVQFDDQKIVSGSYDKKIKVWDLTEGTCLMTLDGHQDAVTCLNLTHDGMKIITGSLDYSLKFWDLSTGKCYGTLDWITSEGHTAVVRCLQVDSWRIVSGGDDKTLKVWELATGQRLLTLRYHSDGVTCMQFNDFAIVSGSYDRTVKLWDFTPKHPYLEAIT